MADMKIRVLGETFDIVVGKAVGPDYEAQGNVRWPDDQQDVEAARDFHVQAVASRDDVLLHRATAADYEFTRQKGFILGPPQADTQSNSQDWIKRGYVGVYRQKTAM